MSFRLFIYYCAAWGGASAFFGWMLGRLIAGDGSLGGAAVKGLGLGLFVAFGLGLLDAMAGSSQRDTASLSIRISITLLIGALGGLLGGFLGQALYQMANVSLLLIFGWTLTGVLIGAAPSAFDFLGAVMRNEERRGAQRKLRNGLIGGTIGGFVGGVVSLLMQGVWSSIFKDAEATSLWSPSAMGFVALGACIGLSVSMTQVILREAWLKVESGFRPGRQLLLTRPQMVIGRAESCDVGLFGDAAVEKVHAKITRSADRWTVEDAGTPTGTLVNGQRIAGATPLKAGDRIQVGGCVLAFDLKTKEPASPPAVIPVT
jgi:hypothetical protein